MFKKIYFSVKTMYYFLLCTVLHPLLCCVPLSSQTGEYHWGLALFRHSSAAPTSLELMEWLLSFALKILQHRFRIVNAFGRSEKKNKLSLPLSVHHVSWPLLGFVFCLAESPAPAVADCCISVPQRQNAPQPSLSVQLSPAFLLKPNTPLFCCLSSLSLRAQVCLNDICPDQMHPKAFGQETGTWPQESLFFVHVE